MRIISFLFPFACKYEEAPYLSTFFRQLSGGLPETTLYILGQPYLDLEQFRDRWEFEPWNQWFHEYQLPQRQPAHTHVISRSLFEPLLERFITPLRAWRHLILERHEPLEREIETWLRRAETLFGGVDCVLSWLNLASLRHVCAQRGIPLIHNEHGPLRKPVFRHTAYFDLRGVNGHTDVDREYEEFAREFGTWDAWPPLERLRDIFLLDPTHSATQGPTPEFRCGVAAQLEEDSNIVAFGNGLTCLELIRYCQHAFGTEQTLIRPHPMAFGLYRGRLDTSPNSIEFLKRCAEIHTINSSVAAECLLFGKPFVIYGDTPLRVATKPCGGGTVRASLPAGENVIPAYYFFLSYLMPYGLLFDIDYYRWRLGQPSHLQRMLAHLRHYAGLPFSPVLANGDDARAEFLTWIDGFAAQPVPSPGTADSGASTADFRICSVPETLREIQELKAQNQALQEERDGMLHSRSWKITAYLRWLDARLRNRT